MARAPFPIRGNPAPVDDADVPLRRALDCYADAVAAIETHILAPLSVQAPKGGRSLAAGLDRLGAAPDLRPVTRRLEAALQQAGEQLRRRLVDTGDLREALDLLAGAARTLEQAAGRTQAAPVPESDGGPEDAGTLSARIRREANHIRGLAGEMAEESQRMVQELDAEMERYRWRLHEAVESAKRDDLTGLHNQRMLHQELRELVEAGTPFCLLLIDLNRFNAINDLHGRHAGDELLRSCAQRLRGLLHAGESTARWGRDEFAVVLSCPHPEAMLRARLLEQKLTGEYDITAGGRTVRVRLGVAMGLAESRPGESADELLLRADRLLTRRIRR